MIVKMKKFLILIVTLLLVVLLIPSNSASARVADSLGDEDKDFFVLEPSNGNMDLEFTGSGKWGDREGLYAPECTVEDGKLVFTGAAQWTKIMSINPKFEFKNAKLTIELVAELINIDHFYSCAREGFANSAPDILREAGIQDIQYDQNGKFVSGAKRNGWLDGSDDWSKDVFEPTEEGYLNMKFEVVTGDKGIAEIGFEIFNTDKSVGTVKIHSLKVTVTEGVSTYFTYSLNTSIEDLDLNGAPWDNQPIYGLTNPVEWETEYPLDGTHSIKITGAAGANQTQIGGFDNTDPNKRLLKQAGLHYIQLDVESSDFQWFNIWTSGVDYYDIKYDLSNGWSVAGNIVKGFNATKLDEGWRISYFVDYTNVDTPHNINVCNGSGSLYFDNLIVAYQDNTPYLQAEATYDKVNTKDVEVAYCGKGDSIAAVNDAGGYQIDASKYSILEDKIVLSKDLFDGENDYIFNIRFEKGSGKQVGVTLNDNRTVLGVSVSGVNKVYDGTTNVNTDEVSFILTNVVEGDEVSFTADLSYTSKNAGENIQLEVSNATLTGADAHKYILPEVISLTGSIAKKTVTVVADAKEKEEGEVDPELTYTVDGLLDEDKLTGALSRLEGEEAGSYDIQLGNLTAPSNYEIEFTGAKLTINAAPSKNESTDNPSAQPEQKGCGGSVVASIFGVLALAGATIVLRKKREE